MNLSKAKEILKLNVKEGGKKMPPDVKDALNLGIEALKRVELEHAERGASFIRRLPGETEE